MTAGMVRESAERGTGGAEIRQTRGMSETEGPAQVHRVRSTQSEGWNAGLTHEDGQRSRSAVLTRFSETRETWAEISGEESERKRIYAPGERYMQLRQLQDLR